MSDYFERVYRRRNRYDPESDKSKVIERGIATFNRYLNAAATKEVIMYDNKEITVSIQTTSQDEVGQRYEKLLLAPLDSNLDVGSIFQWRNDYWLILTVENMSIPTHIKGKIRHCNHVLKWYHGDTLLQCPAHVITNRGLGVQEGSTAGIALTQPSLNIVAIVPNTISTATIKRDQRFIIDSLAARVMSIDDVSVTKLRIITMKEDLIDMGRDVPGDSIADVYIADTETGQVEVGGITYSIEGSNFIIWNQSEEYVAKVGNDVAGNVVFTGLDDNLATVTTEESDNPAEVQANNDGVTGSFDLQCHFVDQDVTVVKAINIISLWG